MSDQVLASTIDLLPRSLVTFSTQCFFERNSSLNKKTAQQRNINEKIASPTDARSVLSACSLGSEPTKTFNETNIAQKLIIVLIVRGNLTFIIMTLHVI